MAGAKSEYLSNYHAVKTSLALMRGVSLSRWRHGLSCMMEKKVGSHLVSKLRSILLLEADMNKANKIIYGERMMNNIRRYHLMPEENFSEKNRTADDGALAKILFNCVLLQLLPRWTLATAMIGLPTLLLPWCFRCCPCFRPLEWISRQRYRCYPLFRR
jgi:hypothetical protein